MFTENNYSLLQKGFRKLALSYTDELLDKIQLYYTFLYEENIKYNITGKLNPEIFIINHLFDCCSGIHHFPPGKKIIDLGSGGGFPGIILGLFRSNPITLIDSNKKKTSFLLNLIQKLNLPHISIVTKNINEYSTPHDIITCRAFGDIQKIKRISRRCAHNNCKYILYKGRKFRILPELNQAKIVTYDIIPLSIPFLSGERNLVVF